MASTVDLAGALAAIEARLATNWTTTPVAYDNTAPEIAMPPVDGEGVPQPWVFCELIDIDSRIVAFGTPGNQTVLDEGKVLLHVLVQKGSGLDVARQYAVALGEIFRQQQFFKDDPTAYVRTYTPQVGRGSMVSDDGNQVSMACTVPYEFFHQA